MVSSVRQKRNGPVCRISTISCKGEKGMVRGLLDDIANYFEYLQGKGYYVSFHNLRIPMEGCMVRLTPYNINSNPFCLMVKSSSEAWNHCIQRQHKVLKACSGGPFCGLCYAGMGECVFPIRNKEGEALAFLSVSGYRFQEEQALKRITAVAERYGHSQDRLRESYYHDLKPGKPDPGELAVLMNPLCHMFELLNLLLSQFPQGTVGNAAQNHILSHAVVYLRRHYAGDVSSAEVAAACHCSVSTLSHLFKQKMGVSIRRYLHDLRMADAKRLLRDTELPINAVSDLLGYGNPNYFCNVFRGETGTAPTRFREQYRR